MMQGLHISKICSKIQKGLRDPAWKMDNPWKKLEYRVNGCKLHWENKDGLDT
jgi:hypothetical protein